MIQINGGLKVKDKKDLSQNCDKDDENKNNDCWNCSYFLFPIGCMFYEEKENESIRII